MDFTFVPPQRSVEIVMGLLAGIELLAATGVNFGAAPPVADPGGFAIDV